MCCTGLEQTCTTVVSASLGMINPCGSIFGCKHYNCHYIVIKIAVAALVSACTLLHNRLCTESHWALAALALHRPVSPGKASAGACLKCGGVEWALVGLAHPLPLYWVVSKKRWNAFFGRRKHLHYVMQLVSSHKPKKKRPQPGRGNTRHPTPPAAVLCSLEQLRAV